MSSVDNRVVAMKFDNKQFQAGVQDTMTSLADLNQSLKMEGAQKGLSQVSDAVSKFSLKSLADGVESIASKFNAMSVVAITAISNITSKAMAAGAQLIKSFTIAPISEGFNDYNEKLTSVQTIMNATGATIETVNGYFTELDTYSDKTIYNLKDMTGAFAKFTNAGVGMDKSVPAIKGIANMVALAGQGADAASIAMYNLSQSIAGGFLTTTDYKSLNLANVATKEWKDNMIAGAVAAGKLEKGAGDAYHIAGTKAGSAYTASQLFNEALAEGWATSDVLLSVLGNYGDATTELGAKAQAAAQNVKSLPMMIDTLKASVGTGWTSTFELLLGNVTESTTLFTGLTNTIQGLLDTSANARNALISDWIKIGGKESLIQGVKNAWYALKAVLAPIKEAFQEIFPPATGETLLKITDAFRKFTAGLMINSTQADQLKRTFKGVFAIIDIGWNIIKRLWDVFTSLTGQFKGTGDGILGVTAKIGDWLVKLDEAVKSGKGFNDFFENAKIRIKSVIDVVKEVVGWFGDMIDKLRGIDASGAGEAVGNLGSRFDHIKDALSAFGDTLGKVGEWIKSFWQKLQPLFSAVGDFFSNLGKGISDALASQNFDKVLDLVNTGLFAGLILIVKKFLKGGLDLNLDVGGGLFDTIKKTFGGLTDTLKTMQVKVKADAIMKIAIAVGILTASVVALSLIDSGKLTSALTGMTVMFVQIGAMMKFLEGVGTAGSASKMGILAVSFGILAGAILLLVASVKILSTLSWNELAKGLTGVIVLMGSLVGASMLLSTNSKGAMAGAAAMVVMAGAVAILAGVVALFASMDLKDLAVGIGAVVVMLGILVGATYLLSTNSAGLIAGATSLLIMGAALTVIAGVMKLFADISWADLAKGLVAMTAALVVLSLAMITMEASLPGAASLVVGAAGVLIMAKALEIIGDMSWNGIAKAVVALFASLLLLSAAMIIMEAVPLGAAAMLVMAAALAILAPVLVTLGQMSWEAIAKGLVALAGIFVAIGAASILLIPALVPLTVLAALLVVLGTGLLLAGAGFLAFATGLAVIAGVGAGAALVLGLLVDGIIGLIPKAARALADGIVEFANVLSGAGPTFVAAAVTLITSIATAIDTTAPIVVTTIVNLINLLLTAIQSNLPKFIDKGAAIIVSFLNGIAKNMPQITTAAGNLIIAFITGIGAQATRITNAAADTIITFVNGLATTVRTKSAEMNAAGQNLATAIIQGMTSGLTGGVGAIATAAKNVAKSALNAAKSFLGIASPSKEFAKLGAWSSEGFAIGITKTADMADAAATNLGETALDALKKSMVNVGDIVSNDMDLTPTIRPVLDLTDIQKGSTMIDGLLTPTAIVPSESYAQASSIAVDQRLAQQAAADISTVSEPTGPLVEITQINNSPKALSEAEVYRQTKNLVSTVKEALP